MAEPSKNVGVDSLLPDGDTAFCPYYHRAVEIIGRRWAGAVIRSLLAGLCRFNEIAEAVPGMSHRVLAQRLRELEADGILVREVYPETPVRIEYRLTPKGKALAEPVVSITNWAENWLKADSPS